MKTKLFSFASCSLAALFLTMPLFAGEMPLEGPVDPFLGEPTFEMQPLFTGARLPNVVVATDGTVVATNGATGGPGDWWKKGYQVRRSEDGGKTYGPPITVANPGWQTGGLTVDESSGDILAFVDDKYIGFYRDAKLTVYRSTDHGKTWNAERIVIQPDNNGNKPDMHMAEHGITLRHGKHKGRLLRPARWFAENDRGNFFSKHYTTSIYSDDGGKTWKTSDPFPENGTGEGAVAELSDGRIFYTTRRHWDPRGATYDKSLRWYGWSDDDGATWSSAAVSKVLPDGPRGRGSNGCHGGLVRLPVRDRDILLYSNCDNPATRDRINGTVWASFDGGTTWPIKRRLGEGKFGYSSLAAGRAKTSSEGWIYLQFEGNPGGDKKWRDRPQRENGIARFNLSWLLEGETTGDGAVPDWITVSEKVTRNESRGQRPNVLMIAVDDLRDWVGYLDACPIEVQTPNIDRLAASGTAFARAYTASSVCCPSRAAVLTGQMPSTSGIYRNDHYWKPNAPDIESIPSYLRRHGYLAIGAGKLFHHTGGHNPPGEWDAYYRNRFLDNAWAYGKYDWFERAYPFTPRMSAPKEFPYSGIRFPFAEDDWGVLAKPEAEYDDTTVFQYGVDFLGQKHDRPFFLACGAFRPHLPWYVPQKYFDLYPLESVKLPPTPENDLEDVPVGGQRMARAKRDTLEMVRKTDKWAEAVQAYLASISYADAQVGRLLDALQSSEYADNTIVVFWSDHGWHFGEKQHWHKSTLWEAATRVPLIVRSPKHGAPRQRCDRTVSLVDIFPTLIDLCDLPPLRDQKMDGHSLKPLIENPHAARQQPAVTELFYGNAAVRSERYRYIRYADRGEELYDHNHDPHEWHNLASQPQSKAVIRRLAEHLPKSWRERALASSDYTFQPDSYTWTRKSDGKVFQGGSCRIDN